MSKQHFTCPCCNQKVEIELDTIRVMISNPEGTVGTTKEFKAQTNQPSTLNENWLKCLSGISDIEKELLRRLETNQGKKPELIDLLCEASKRKLEILNKFG